MNFIDKYYETTKDGFAPDKFHYWSAISVVAAALERKVFIKAEKFTVYPNLYILLVALPGEGKSTCIDYARTMLTSVTENPIRVFPEQLTQASFIRLMSESQTFEHNNKLFHQSTAYLSFSEASNSALGNIHGDFVSCITDFYDCKKEWARETVSRGNDKIQNLCVNMIAGCTFSYLRELVNAQNITGGFASRVLYITQNEPMERHVSFKRTFMGDDLNYERAQKMAELSDDLTRIHSLVGPMKWGAGVGQMWEEWFNHNDAKRRAMDSEVMQSILARKATNAKKLAIILSVAESSSMVIEKHHWLKALDLTDQIDSSVVQMFMKSRAHNSETQEGINNQIYMALKDVKMTRRDLERKLVAKSIKPVEIRATLEHMLSTELIRVSPSGYLTIGIDSDSIL